MRTLGSSIYQRLVIIVPYAWLLVFFLAPFLIVFRISLSTKALSVPPYDPAFSWSDSFSDWWDKLQSMSFDNYTWLAGDPLYFNAYLQSLKISGISTILTLIIAYPIAYGMAQAPRSIRPTLLMLVILPFWTSFLIRVYSWMSILSTTGLLNQLLMTLGIIHEPLVILNTNTAVYIGMVYSYLPFMVLPLYSSLEKMDGTLIEAAQDLGCTPIGAFWRVTFPLSIPGVIAGCMLVFIPAVGEFVIPDLLGGSETLMIGKVLWSEFYGNTDWPLASAVATILLLVLVIPIVFFQHIQAKADEKGR
ncbi:ABC transporter permease subunit [Rhizobium sp. LEGMi198b]|uniref:ABC transporter permease subunit n=1 Tax=unclassified Rhizobium TaxID=2613769 RepID=UPI0024B1D407|nr:MULTISPECIES: ABC transporter permease subunit [unclassified Rhizobium]MDK4742113.1 ABC transporter permease subunit [Rhizobium sp. CNPSo 3464]WFU02489.1 ABC transporter permease subunit [Rhizobium sp. CB3171]